MIRRNVSMAIIVRYFSCNLIAAVEVHKNATSRVKWVAYLRRNVITETVSRRPPYNAQVYAAWDGSTRCNGIGQQWMRVLRYTTTSSVYSEWTSVDHGRQNSSEFPTLRCDVVVPRARLRVGQASGDGVDWCRRRRRFISILAAIAE